MAVISPGLFWNGWLACGLLLWASVFGLLYAWRWAGGGRMLFWLVCLAFVLRLGGGIVFSLALPVFGNNEPVQKAGYLFFDAYRRDQEAWKLAQSTAPVWQVFVEEFSTDQYGGLLVISALLYRYLSPDAQRPYLILTLSALIFALGIPFFWHTLRQRFKPGVALAAAWLLVLYPDAILYSASQMREPYILGLVCITLWAVSAWQENRRTALIVGGAAWLGMAVISSRAAVAVAALLALWFWLEYFVGRGSSRQQLVGWIGLGLAGVGVVAASWGWLAGAASWDLLVTRAGSGMMARSLEGLSPKLQVPFIVGYGLTQPLLPAAIFEDALPFWKALVTWRALGWYLLVPFLLYGVFAVWTINPVQDRRLMICLMLASAGWIVLASARAGGDLWDSPRYRMFYFPFTAILVGYLFIWARQQRDPWLLRWLLVEVIFLGFFFQWYIARYVSAGRKLPVTRNLLYIAILSALVLGGGWIWDWFKKKKAKITTKS